MTEFQNRHVEHARNVILDVLSFADGAMGDMARAREVITKYDAIHHAVGGQNVIDNLIALTESVIAENAALKARIAELEAQQ